jgi:glycosyltransferase involved in cell wall biosynthesis
VIPIRAFTTGLTVPGPRYRVFQFASTLQAAGYALHARNSPFGGYPPRTRWVRPLWAAASLLWRTAQVLESRREGITFFQRELLSTFATVEWMSGRPRILDVDDAIWLNGRGAKTDAVAARADVIICGNEFLAEHYRRLCEDVVILPTAVDVAAYPCSHHDARETCVIGWSGTSGGFKYIQQIETALATVLQLRPATRLRVMADRPPTLPLLPPGRVDYVKWSPDGETREIAAFDIGIMPLADTEWERGKCSYKMLQYMAAGLPVVVSPVGMNVDVLSAGQLGVGARTTDEWVDALLMLIDARDRRAAMGAAGRAVASARYGKDVVGRGLVAVLDRVSGR